MNCQQNFYCTLLSGCEAERTSQDLSEANEYNWEQKSKVYTTIKGSSVEFRLSNQ